jgi:hypothetical protein
MHTLSRLLTRLSRIFKKKRSIGGWVLLIVAIAYNHVLPAIQNYEWAKEKLGATVLSARWTPMVFFALGLIWLAVVALWPEASQAQDAKAVLEPPAVAVPRVEIIGCESPRIPEALVLINHGEPAYNIEINPVRVGTSNLEITRGIERLTKEDGKKYVDFEIDGTCERLFDVLRRQKLDGIDVVFHYQDWNHRKHEGHCRIERDVLAKGGLSFRHGFAGQSVSHETNISHLRNNQDRPALWVGPKQREQIMPMLRPFRNRKMAVFVHRASEDTKAFGRQLDEIIRAAGIDSKIYVGEMGVNPPPEGLSISATKQNADLAYILRAALAEAVITNGPVDIQFNPEETYGVCVRIH